MKKLLIAFVFLCSANIASAQAKKPVTTKDTTIVPALVQEKFTKEYPAITPAWTVDGKNYKAFYTDPKTNMSQLIVYDKDGNVLRRENELDKMQDKHAQDPKK